VVVCDVSSRIGRARRTRRPARLLRSFALLESPFADSDGRPGQGAVNRSVLSWTFFPSRACSSKPWVRSSRGQTRSGRTRASFILETQATGQAFRQLSDPAVGSRTHGPSTSPVDRTGRRHRRAANLMVSGFAFRSPPVRQPRARARHPDPEVQLLARARDVLPAPPLGGAPRLRSFVRAPPQGGARVDLGDTNLGLLVGRPLAGPAISSGVLPLFEPARGFERTRRAA